MKSPLPKGVTLLELLVVLVIISILSSVAVGVYSNQVMRAKYSRTRAEIRTLEVAITTYEVDTGHLPPSGSGTNLAPNSPNPSSPYQGSGYLQLALRGSLNGNPHAPLTPRWQGPYVDWDYNRMGNLQGQPITGGGANTALPSISFLDPFGNPYYYIRHQDYEQLGGTRLPSQNPFFQTETWYNPSTFQIVSFGANGTSMVHPRVGEEVDDITNFRSSDF